MDRLQIGEPPRGLNLSVTGISPTHLRDLLSLMRNYFELTPLPCRSATAVARMCFFVLYSVLKVRSPTRRQAARQSAPRCCCCRFLLAAEQPLEAGCHPRLFARSCQPEVALLRCGRGRRRALYGWADLGSKSARCAIGNTAETRRCQAGATTMTP